MDVYKQPQLSTSRNKYESFLGDVNIKFSEPVINYYKPDLKNNFLRVGCNFLLLKLFNLNIRFLIIRNIHVGSSDPLDTDAVT